MRVYKFIEKDVLEQIRANGTVKLSSAEKIRADERGKVGEGDGGYADDLELATKWAPGPRSELLTPDHPFITKSNLRLEKPVMLHIAAGAEFVFGGSAHLFCASTSRSAEVVRGMRDRFGYNASYAINDINALGRAVCRALGKTEFHSDAVTYQDFETSSLTTFDKTAFHKPSRFAWQQEYRLIFEGQGDDQIVKVPGFWRFISSIRHH